MGLLMQTIYNGIFNYFCLPVFILMLIGRPRFLINLVHKFIHMREPFFKLKLYRFIFFLCCLTVAWSYFRKYTLDKLIEQLTIEQAKIGGSANIHFIDEKLREAHLFERNTYMFSTFVVIMIIVEKFCISYFKLWALQDQVNEKRLNAAAAGFNKNEERRYQEQEEIDSINEKDPLLKKIE